MQKTLSQNTPNVAAGSDDSLVIGEVPFDATVIGVSYTPEAAMTGDNTNKRVFTLVNKGQSGSGTTVIATLDMITGVNGVAFDEKPMTLSVTAADLLLVAGDILAFVSTHVASGIADPGGLVQVTFDQKIA